MNRRQPKVRITGLRLGALAHLYSWRIREHRIQELLAGVGIAIGIALFFGALIANTSLIGSSSQVVHAVAGSADFEVAGRSPEGFDERLALRAGALSGVKVAAPVLRQNAEIVGPNGRDSIQLVGVAAKQILLGGSVTRNLGAAASLLVGGLGLPTSVAERVGAEAGTSVQLLFGGERLRLEVRAVVGSQLIGPVASSPVVVTSLRFAQRILKQPNRVTEMLVEARPGARGQVRGELRQLVGDRLDVLPAEHEVSVLKATAKPTSESTLLFAAISAMVGFLLALNAVLLTVPERRRFVADLREQGYGPRQILVILSSQAVILGAVASLAGIGLGYLLSSVLFHQAPSYLTFAFPIGTHLIVPFGTVALAFVCGVFATVLASLLPLLDFRRSQKRILQRDAGEPGQRIGKATVAASGALGVALIAAVTAAVLLAPSLSVVGGIILALAAFCLIPVWFTAVVRLLKPLSERIRGSMLALAIVELEGTATRSIALAGVAALAVYGTVAIQGARRDLITGLDAAVVQYLDTADIWITTNNNFLTIDGFDAGSAPAAIARLPAVASVREYQGQLLDVGTRRLWIRARPPGDGHLLQASQLLSGDEARATAQIRQGGWAAVSNGFAKERHLQVGRQFGLPTPSGMARFKVAAITTNVGWPPGAITLSAGDYRHYWRTSTPTALEINLRSGADVAAAKRAIEATLGTGRSLLVETFEERKQRYDESAQQGIKSLNEIFTLLLIASALSIAFALSAAIWQRRPRLAALRAQGFNTAQLWRSLLLESALLLGTGCADGVILGVFGHAFASRWLEASIGFPAPFSLGLTLVLATVGLLICVALVAVALPGVAAARVTPTAGFQE
ncbi:MAG TPA: FtsX-like permease family protein [Solirubrobacteraceae bacterium]|jgi:putative ABC transport system permease protein|nr:FtsX-like permease family protein [Solirubrobacteraceae bacterium]